MTKFKVVRYWDTYPDGLIATCDTKEEAEKICEEYNKKHRCNFKYHYKVKIDDKKSYLHIKPKQGYRPFKNAEECWQEMMKHQPFGWVKMKGTESKYYMLKCIASRVVIGLDETPFSYKKVFEDYVFADGTPFGVKVEE